MYNKHNGLLNRKQKSGQILRNFSKWTKEKQRMAISDFVNAVIDKEIYDSNAYGIIKTNAYVN